MTTASLFNSEYTGGDKVWRSTRYSRNYLVNFLIGKEWYFGDNRKVFGLNFRMTTQGGERYVPYFEAESIANKTVRFDYDNAFSSQLDPEFIFHFSLNYKINKVKTTHVFALKVLNATGYGDFQGFKYNLQTKQIDTTSEIIVIPDLSYKFSF